MLLGAHISLDRTPQLTRQRAASLEMGVFQTGWGNMQSYNLSGTLLGHPIDQYPRDFDLERDPVWVIHAPYVTHCTPKDGRTAGLIEANLKMLMRHAQALGATFIVVHTGGTKERTALQVISAIRNFLTNHGIVDFLKDLNKKQPLTLAVENVAAKYDFNQDLHNIVNAIEGLPHVSWCLDLAHRHAAGVSDANLLSVLDRRPPSVCHSNFPGSNFASGLDRHGWRHKDSVGSHGLSQQDFVAWDSIIRRLHKLRVPLIMEGSSNSGDMNLELQEVRRILADREQNNPGLSDDAPKTGQDEGR